MKVEVADMHAHVYRLVSGVKMGTVLDQCIIEEQHFLWAKRLNAKDVHK
jgi:hypothetical protein